MNGKLSLMTLKETNMNDILKELKVVLDFGKYKGKTLDEVGDIDPSYICWLKENVKDVKIPKWYAEACERDVREWDESIVDEMGSFGERDF